MGFHRLPIVVGIAAIAGVAGCDGKSTKTRGADPIKSDPVPSGSASAKAAVFAPEGPSLGSGSSGPQPALPPDPNEPPPPAKPAIPDPGTETNSPVEALASQDRDPSWAGPIENEIRRRMTKLEGARLEATECRHDRCVLTFRGSQDDLATTLAKLESDKGLHGYARSIYLTAPQEQGGTFVVRAYASFDRD